MSPDEPVSRSKEIHRQTGKTFYVATRFLPERVRRATYVLYAFFRVADEIVDTDRDITPREQRARLESVRRKALGEESAEGTVVGTFSELREAYGIDDWEVHTFVNAMVMDTWKSEYANYDQLDVYMEGSAASVGRMMTAIIEPDDPEVALPHATVLGKAFQLTNFVRDVREDVLERDRVYLPVSTLEDHGASAAQIRALEFDENVAGAVRHELLRAEQLYEEGVAGIKYLPEDTRFPILLAAVLYAEHHRLIRNREYDVVSATPSLSLARKLLVVARTAVNWAFYRDPETVFRKVSAVGHADLGRTARGPCERLPTR